MSDPRLTPDPDVVTGQEPARITQPVADLCRAPEGPRDRQLLYGAAVTILGARGPWRYVQATSDGYCGYVRQESLGPPDKPTHRVTSIGSHLYERPDFKAPDIMALSHGSLLTVLSASEKFAETPDGFVPIQHVKLLPWADTDPAAIAEIYLGAPYLWGGNSNFGIDCSGLVQAACHSCGIACPGDSDMQAETLGDLLEKGTPFARNDLLFWKGHVALVWDSDTLIHANVHAMATTFEPIESVLARIAQTDGPVIAHRRLPRF